METLFIFIAKSSGLLVLFYLAYHFLLSKETFFDNNRWFLLAGLATSVVLPFLVYTKIVWVAPTPISIFDYSQTYLPKNIPEKTIAINWGLVLLVIYCIGFLGFLIKFAIDFYSLNTVLKGKKVQKQADFKFIDVSENIAPFSYFDYIVYNSSRYNELELENILEHEKVHSDQNHTIDVLISRVFCVLFWFNPIIWLYKKAILQNLEFIADSEAAKKISDKKAYQYTLLKITTQKSCVAITNHFYQSLIKKRIVMLNKNQSKKRNYWKLYAIIPALVVFVLIFQIETIAQEKKEIKKEISEENIQSMAVYKIKKTTTDQELKEIPKKLKQNHDVEVTISDVKRNTENELIAIRVDAKIEDKDVQTIHLEGNKAIINCGIIIITNEDSTKNIHLVANDNEMGIPALAQTQKTEEKGLSYNVAVPTPPMPPVFPNGPMPKAPAPDMSKMPKPPVHPTNLNNKTAMKKFEKEMAEFEKKMEDFAPDMSAYEKQIEEIMAKRGMLFEKNMEKYEKAMEKYQDYMKIHTENIQKKYGTDPSEYEESMKQFQKNRKEYEKIMKSHEEEMKKIEG